MACFTAAAIGVAAAAAVAARRPAPARPRSRPGRREPTPAIGVLWVLAGLVMSARLYLQAHTLREVGYGAAVGFLVGFFGMILLF